MGIRIVTDSSCDLPETLAQEHGISIVPLSIRFGAEEFVDRAEMSPEQFWDKMATASVLPETAAPSPGAFEETFRKLIADGATGIICVNLSSGLSATMQSAELAARAIGDDCDIRIFDSRSASMGVGNLAVAAASKAAQGADLDAIVADLEGLRDRTRLFAALDTLDNLKKGGRIGGAQAFFGTVLSIKPIVEITQGAVEPKAKVRTRSKALQFLVDMVTEHGASHLAVLHGGATDLEAFLDMLAPIYPRDEIVVGYIGSVVGTHAGPGIIAVIFEVPSE